MTRLALFAALLSTMALIPASALSLRGREIYPIPDDVQTQMRKYTWKADCPVPISSLTYLQLNYLDEGGVVHQGELVVHRSLATEVLDIFEVCQHSAQHKSSQSSVSLLLSLLLSLSCSLSLSTVRRTLPTPPILSIP